MDLWIGCFGLIAALAVLPLPTVSDTPEIASILAVGAIALLAGHRWGLAVVVLADIALIGALWPRAFIHDPTSTEAQVGVALGLLGALPGLVSVRRGIPAIAELLIGRATARAQLTTRLALVGFAGFWLVAPLL